MTRDADNLCLRLDDFLSGELAPSEADEFRGHMTHCAVCQEAADQQSWIDGLLRSNDAAALEAAPLAAGVQNDAVGRGPGERRRVQDFSRRRVLAVAMAAGIALLVASPIYFLLRGTGNDALPPVAAKPERTSTDPPTVGVHSAGNAADATLATDPRLQRSGTSQAAFVSSGSTIAIPVASPDPKVTVVQLYPTVTATRRWTREAALRAIALPSNGG